MGLTLGGLSACVAQPKYGVPATAAPYEAVERVAPDRPESQPDADPPAAADERPASAEGQDGGEAAGGPEDASASAPE